MVCKKCIAEFIGTFALVFCGTAAIAVGVLDHLGIALTFAVTLGMMIFALGHVSGAHFNPAVTLGLASGGKMDKKGVVPYVVSQLLGATAAAAVVLFLFGTKAAGTVTLPSGALLNSFVAEVIMTFFLVFVITAVATDKRAPQGFAGLAIGGTLLFNALWGGPISGGSLNPARSFGPALIHGNFSHFWLYVVAPLVGAVLAVHVYKMLEEKKGK